MSNDIICAVSTPAGVGGIAVIRVSGHGAIEAVDRLWRGKRLSRVESHTAHLGTITDPATGEAVDCAVATVFRGPHSFTGDDTVELSIHGSLWLQKEVTSLLCRTQSVRMAQAGEFTRRAFLSGNLDLTQAEAVADIIAADSHAAHRIASTHLRGGFSKKLADMRNRMVELASLLELELDFSEEDIEFASRENLISLATAIADEADRLAASFQQGDALLHGVPVAIIGPTNAGKSSLLNALIGDDRAIVSHIHGTTRDIVEDTITIEGIRFRLRDTAGLRDTADTIESIGIERSRNAASTARLLLVVTAPDTPISWTELTKGITVPDNVIAVANKCDIGSYLPDGLPPHIATVKTSAKTSEGITALRHAMAETARPDNSDENAILVTNARHAEALTATSAALHRLIDGLENARPTDLAAEDLRDAIHHLGAITGAITTPELLSTVFSRFCIGK